MDRAGSIALKVAGTLLLIIAAPVIFLWTWGEEQPAALRRAWHESFAGLPATIRELWDKL
jgi:hypothetical protein